jgi:hypothetical protein
MINNLVCHPDVTCPTKLLLSVEVLCQPDNELHLHYHLQGDLQYLRIPERQTSAMIDGLWEHTCFEAFIAIEGDKGYQEFNFSPSRQWASYLFSDYRERRDWHSDHVYALNVERNANNLRLKVIIPLAELPLLDTNKTIQVGLTAVIETVDGSRSYWALHHPADEPDFHHRAGFVYTIEPHSF